MSNLLTFKVVDITGLRQCLTESLAKASPENLQAAINHLNPNNHTFSCEGQFYTFPLTEILSWCEENKLYAEPSMNVTDHFHILYNGHLSEDDWYTNEIDAKLAGFYEHYVIALHEMSK
ncbi:MAG: hypothetical protein CMF13_02190 [Idiomarina sp.]|nr:hypothetical protein [Idiomarina sp.]|tara:strand:+ start:4078 stop:4434 length:357 start_codon:yes stop_codon:yes gene_type:complete